MLYFTLLSLLASASGLQLLSSYTTAASAARQRSLPLLLAEEKAASVEVEEDVEPPLGLPILTLKDRDDGWNDVRQSIIKGKKERAPAWNALNAKYIGPVTRWSKVIADEVGLIDLQAPKVPTDLSLPTLSAPKLPATKRDQVKAGVNGLAGALKSLPQPKAPAKKAVAPPKKTEVVPAVANVAFPAAALVTPGILLAIIAYQFYAK